MTLEPGVRLGAYEIVSLLGAGGMGEVYRAKDTKLGRDVALKILPDAFTTDPDWLARFRREAQVLASLNHPHIGAIYGLDDANGQQFLVLELVDGESLDKRIARERIPVDEALGIARQIAEALEAAHEKGIVHRDLKPANIAITNDGTVKVLDFGLAKAMEPASGAPVGLANSPTLTSPAMMTSVGIILGTAAYMSPEQARGKSVDRKTDTWAFGCVLYEMLTGTQAFKAPGETVSDAIAVVLLRDPDLNALPAETPTHVRTLIRRCLQKDLVKRLPHIGVARLELDDGPDEAVVSAAAAIAVPDAKPRPLWKRALPVSATAIVVGGLAASAAWTLKPTPARPITRFAVALPGDMSLNGTVHQFMAISPDGSRLVYEDNQRLYVRLFSETDARPIQGTDAVSTTGLADPVFSPDGESIAYVSASDGALKRIAVTGGVPLTVCPLDGQPFGMDWYSGGILFELPRRGIFRVPANGGTPELLIKANPSELMHSPQMLPNLDTILYTVAPAGSGNTTWDNSQIVAYSLKTGSKKSVVKGATEGRYVPSGHIVYAVRGVLFAIAFDVRRLEVGGAPVPLVEGVRTELSTVHYSVSNTGALVYVPGPFSGVFGQLDLALMDEFKGAVDPLKSPPGAYETPRVSPDGKRVAVGTNDGKDQTIWIYDLSGANAMRRLTFGGKNRNPVWSMDSQRVAFSSDREGNDGIWWQRADGTGTAERLTKAEAGIVHVPASWSSDGTSLLFSAGSTTSTSLWTLSMTDRKQAPLGGQQIGNASNATLSPDGKWMAYQSTETGNAQIFVQPFPPSGTKYQVTRTSNNNLHPVWSHDGRHIFALTRTELISIDVRTTPSFEFSDPKRLSRGPLQAGGAATARNYDAMPDGRLLIVVAAGQAETAPARAPQLNVVLNWLEELKQRVPTR